MLATVVLVTQLVTASLVSQEPDPLPRRADLGAVFRPPTVTAPARVVRVIPGSSLDRAGLRAGDELVALDDRPLTDPVEFERRVAACVGARNCG